MRISTNLLIWVAAIALGACTAAGPLTPTGKDTITRSYVLISQGWQRQDTETLLIYTARDRGGMTEVCGAIFTDGISTIRALEPRILRNTLMEAPSGVLLNDLRFFNRLTTLNNSSQANCVVTASPWEQRLKNQPPLPRSRSSTYEI
ncbi:MAG: hypothetical protein AAF848_15595 [Pseudomonadota bacterium]